MDHAPNQTLSKEATLQKRPTSMKLCPSIKHHNPNTQQPYRWPNLGPHTKPPQRIKEAPLFWSLCPNVKQHGPSTQQPYRWPTLGPHTKPPQRYYPAKKLNFPKASARVKEDGPSTQWPYRWPQSDVGDGCRSPAAGGARPAGRSGAPGWCARGWSAGGAGGRRGRSCCWGRSRSEAGPQWSPWWPPSTPRWGPAAHPRRSADRGVREARVSHFSLGVQHMTITTVVSPWQYQGGVLTPCLGGTNITWAPPPLSRHPPMSQLQTIPLPFHLKSLAMLCTGIWPSTIKKDKSADLIFF